MNQESATVFIYLASIYIVNGLLLSLCRRIRIADFIIHVATGVVWGVLMSGWTGLFESYHLPNEPTAIIQFLVEAGVLLFMMYIGFNFEWALLKLNSRRVYEQSLLLMIISAATLGVVGYYLLFEGALLPLAVFIAAFLSINIGGALSANFPISGRVKFPLTNLVQIAVILDIAVIMLYSGFRLYFDLRIDNFEIQLILSKLPYWILLILFILPVTASERIKKVEKLVERPFGNYMPLFKIGMFFLFIYSGIMVNLPVVLLGAWAGLVAKELSSNAQFDIKQKFFPKASFLMLLPFVEIGRYLVTGWELKPESWETMAYILLALIFIAAIFGTFVVRSRAQSIVMGLGTFPRGEMTILVLWLSRDFYHDALPVMSPDIIGASIVVVIFTSLLSKLLARFMRVKPSEIG